jgi:uncharacterized protein YecE (DUF72 family)
MPVGPRARPSTSSATSVTTGDVRVGISGWRYPAWRSVFYPEGLPQHRELAFASRAFRTIEINGSFYSLQRPSSYLTWYDEAPAGFVFAVKGSRFITHNKKLRDCVRPLANFFASGVLALEDKLGPILWQLPPQLGFDAERIEGFFASLPRTTAAAAELARGHDERIKHGAYVDVRGDWPIRYALEVRHESFHDPAFPALLAKANVAVCVASAAGPWPYLEDVTADFVYVRLHGATQLYASGYSSAELDVWADRIDGWRRGRPRAHERRERPHDVYVYFDNDAQVRAPFDAMNLAARFGHGHRVAFPRGLYRAAQAARAARASAEASRSSVEEPRSRWDRWRYGQRRTA